MQTKGVFEFSPGRVCTVSRPYDISPQVGSLSGLGMSYFRNNLLLLLQRRLCMWFQYIRYGTSSCIVQLYIVY